MSAATPPAPLPRAFALAAACAIWPRSDRRNEAIRRAAQGFTEWDRFLRVAQRQRIQGLAQDGLSAAGVALPPAIAASLTAEARTIARDSLTLVAEAARLSDEFARANVPVAFIKGPTLAAMAYGDVGVRHAKDLDLLVEGDRARDAIDAMERAGFALVVPQATTRAIERWTATRKDFVFLHPARKVMVELHWRLTANPYLMPRAPKPAAWIEQKVAGPVSLKTFARDDIFAYLVAHGASHAWFRLKWLADIGALFETATPEEARHMMVHAAALDLTRPRSQATLLCSWLFGTVVPALPGDAASERLARMALRALTGGGGEVEPRALSFATSGVRLSQYLLRSDWRFRWAQLRLDLMSGDDRMLMMMPERLAFLFPLLRLPRWAWKRATHGGRWSR